MDGWNRMVSDVAGLVKSWFPWRSEPAHVSRDFWMPDESCRVCYECDSQFTLFNRRHHCRHCGRIFCANCTSHWVPTEPSEPKASPEEWDKIRVCNYCFKLWEQRLMVPLLNELQAADLDASSTSISVTSFLSTRSSITCGSGGITYAILPQSACFSQHQSAVMESSAERESAGAVLTSDHPMGVEEPTWSQHRLFCQNRSDDEDEEFETPHFSQVNGYYDQAQFDDTNTDYKLHKVYPDGDVADSRSISNSPGRNSFDFQASEEVQLTTSEEAKHDSGDECETPSSLYVAGDVNAEPMDFENNGVLWLPPEPEDEEDEREALLFEEEAEEGSATGEWGGLHHTRSFGSEESRNKDKSTDENKRALKNVVSGHFRALIAQLLQVENLLEDSENENESWLEIITALSWEAATLLKPDTSKGGQMDPAGYVKVKCLASGLRNECLVVKGIVCRKHVAHRRMTSKIEKPRLLILGGALQYQRVSNALSSFDTLLQQEMDHLKMAVAKIKAHNPRILLVEKSVSRHAQEYLLAKDITLVLNIKRPLLERIARCTGAQIVPSVDHLSSTKLGYCDMFHVERVSEEHDTAGQAGKTQGKTLMYFEGCPRPLGCTILLRGACSDELKKVKHVIQYGIFAAYHLALETSFLADEGASLPDLPLNSPITVALPDKASIIDRSISTIPSLFVPTSTEAPGPQTVSDPLRANSMPTSDLIKVVFASTQRSLGTCNVSGTISSLYPENLGPHYVKGSPLSALEGPSLHPFSENRGNGQLGLSTDYESHGADVILDTHITGDLGDGNAVTFLAGDSDGIKFSDRPSLQLDGKGNLEEQPALKEDFPPPADHQSILVSLSSRCVWKGTICERPNLFRIKYYSKNDKPLGRFLRDHLFDQNYTCSSCEMPAEAHVLCYTHRQDTLTISVKKLSEVLLPGERDGKIWMWHRCLRCPRTNGFPPATSRVLMSDAAWGLSFGKFLELSFSNNAAASRVASCGHSLHRDCLRFYGFGKMVACFRYAAIDVFSVRLPLPKLDFNCESQEWIERELNEVTGRAELLFSEILNSLLLVEKQSSSGLRDSTLTIRDPGSQIEVLEGMLQDEKLQFKEWLRQIVNKDANKGQPVVDILELNRLRRELFFLSYVWDHRLRCAALSDDNDQSNDAEITSTDKILDTNVPIVMGKPLSASESDAADAKPQQPDNGVIEKLRKCADVVHSSTDVYGNFGHGNQTPLVLSSGMKATDEFDPLVSGVTVRRALSDGQSPICLSDTLDAAWTGESHPGLGTPQNNCSSESVADTSSTVGESNKLDVEEHKQDLSMSKVSQPLSLFSTRSSDSVEEPASWLSTPFLSFYRSYKNFLGTPQKLDKISEYDPVYISSFRESELRSGACWSLPVGVNGTTVPVYEDEPTSIISYTLLSPDLVAQLSDETDRPKDVIESTVSMQSLDVGALQSFHSLEETMLESYRNLGSGDESMTSSMSPHSSLALESLSHVKSLDARVSFLVDGSLGKAKYTVTCYHANCFKALREICCPSEVDYIRSLSRCKKWGAQGGKSNVFFAKTLDDRFIVKQVTKTELESFVKFAPSYFKYLTESIHSRSPTCLAKILGIYQVASKQVKGGKETKMDLLVIENLLFSRNVTRLYDLKGSSRSRYNPDSSGSNKVLLDQNLIEAMPTSPIFVGDRAKKLLERAVWNDTAFLASIDVMDYSLLVGVDEEKHELVLGIIDFMRQYTWDKHLETWVKASGILGGPKNVSPTVISPKQYKRRFRKAMSTYFFKVLDQWSAPPPTTVANQSPTELSEENSQNPPGTTSE